jgi:5-methylcytosine-specific restriction endonuclease McrA
VARIAVPSDVQDKIILLARCRCCVCFGLCGDVDVKARQIVPLDHNHNNNEPDNLAFLCLVHHDQYDSKTSQSKSPYLILSQALRSKSSPNLTDPWILAVGSDKRCPRFGAVFYPSI